ncbi:hypothetical protein TWF679_004236 [Orbilia oligospora]|uniref:Uncharacterized protein n=1 Tax=Orbilia oligospora TaxID=2813651 RepID=A0A8H8VMC0_ORBOL|nr:hypothetical protein TWF679_004236 [Orbilia oligospora]
MKARRKKPQIGFLLLVLGGVSTFLNSSPAIAYSPKELWEQPKEFLSKDSILGPVIDNESPRKLRDPRPKSAVLDKSHFHAKRDLSDYNERGWKLMDEAENSADKHLGESNAMATVVERYLKPRIDKTNFFYCPDLVQVFLSIFDLESLAQTGDQLDKSYWYFVLNSKAKELGGSWGEFYVTVDKSHMIITWWHITSDIREIFEKDYDVVMIAMWFSTVREANFGNTINYREHPPRHITIPGIKSEKVIQALEEIQTQLSGNVNSLGGYSMERPESLSRDNFAAHIWAALIGIPEIGAIERMLNKWSTFFPPRYQIKFIRFNTHTLLDGNREAILSVNLRSGPDTSKYNTAESLAESTQVMILEDDTTVFKNYPAIEIFEASTLELIAPGPATGAGSKRKAELPAPTYRMSKWLLITSLGNPENFEIKISTSSRESHLVMLDSIGTEQQQIVADFLYLSWIQTQGTQDLRDITFLQLSPSTEALIQLLATELKVEISKQSVFILWGRGHWRRTLREKSTAEPSSERRINNNLLRRFSQTVEYGAVLKMILQQQRYPGVSPGFELRSIEIGDGTEFKRSKGLGTGDNKPSATKFAMLIRLERSQDVVEDEISISGTSLNTQALFDEFEVSEIESESPSPQPELRVLEAIAARAGIPSRDPSIEESIRNSVPTSPAVLPQELSGHQANRFGFVFGFDFIPPLDKPNSKPRLSNIHTETSLVVRRFDQVERREGSSPLPYLDAIARTSNQDAEPQYYHFSLWIQYEGTTKSFDAGEFYVSPSLHHIVIKRLPDIKDVSGETYENLALSKLLYPMISALCEGQLQMEEGNIPTIDFISFENVDSDTEAFLKKTFDDNKLDQSSRYMKLSIIDSLLAVHVPEKVQNRKSGAKDRKYVLNYREILLGTILRTREVSGIHEMAINYYKGQYVGDKILDNIFVTWRKRFDGTFASQILLVLRDVPEKLKHSDIVEWIQMISKAVHRRRVTKAKPTPDERIPRKAPPKWNAVVVGQALISKINQGALHSGGLAGPSGNTGSDGRDKPPLLVAELPPTDLPEDVQRPTNLLEHSRTKGAGQLLIATLQLGIPETVDASLYAEYFPRHETLKEFRPIDGPTRPIPQVYFIDRYVVTIDISLCRQLMFLNLVNRISSQKQLQDELEQVYEQSWFSSTGEPPALRMLLILAPTDSSVDVIQEVLGLRKQQCTVESEPGGKVIITKPAHNLLTSTENNHFTMDVEDPRDTLEWATLIGIPEIAAIVEVGLKRRGVKETWFSPFAIVIYCEGRDRRGGYPLLRIGLRLAHYYSATGAEIQPDWLHNVFSP